MEITKITRKKEDGTYEATLVLTEAQTQFLINFALGMLVQSGMATIIETEFSEAVPSEPLTPETIN
jgi:hypothetical protein